MANRIICVSRPADNDSCRPPELRMIDPATSATNHKYEPTPDEDAGYLATWLRQYLPPATWESFVQVMKEHG